MEQPSPAAKPAANRGRQAAPTAARGELCVRVVDEAESRRLNHDYRHKDAPTNVLSFPADIDLPEVLVWGDVVVCAPVVAREAVAQRKQYEDHFAHMVVHGVLHLLGYDHQAADEAAAMERLEAYGYWIVCHVSDPLRGGRERRELRRPRSGRCWTGCPALFSRRARRSKRADGDVAGRGGSSAMDADALNIIFGALQVSDMQARDIMIPRSQLVYLKAGDPPDMLLPIVIESQHSRFPSSATT